MWLIYYFYCIFAFSFCNFHLSGCDLLFFAWKSPFNLSFFFVIFIYLAVPGLSCDTWDLHCSTWDLLVAAFGLLVVACVLFS